MRRFRRTPPFPPRRGRLGRGRRGRLLESKGRAAAATTTAATATAAALSGTLAGAPGAVLVGAAGAAAAAAASALAGAPCAPLAAAGAAAAAAAAKALVAVAATTSADAAGTSRPTTATSAPTAPTPAATSTSFTSDATAGAAASTPHFDIDDTGPRIERPVLEEKQAPPHKGLDTFKVHLLPTPREERVQGRKHGILQAEAFALVRGESRNLVPHQLFDMVFHLIARAPLGRAQVRGRRRRRRAGRGGRRDRIRILGSATRRGQRSRRSGTGCRPLGRLQLALQARNLLTLSLNDGLVRFVAGVAASRGMGGGRGCGEGLCHGRRYLEFPHPVLQSFTPRPVFTALLCQHFHRIDDRLPFKSGREGLLWLAFAAAAMAAAAARAGSAAAAAAGRAGGHGGAGTGARGHGFERWLPGESWAYLCGDG